MISAETAVAPLLSKALVLIDQADAALLSEQVEALKGRAKGVMVVDYGRLMDEVPEVRKTLARLKTDFVIFSRNDQVYDQVSIGPFIRALGVGYSTFSGIDPKTAEEDARGCLEDLLSGSARADFPATIPSDRGRKGRGTFSLVFDTEQLACVRHGLPRVLELLDRYDARATFFATSFVDQVYAGLVEELEARGHEVGLHGRYHEYLAGQLLGRQVEMIQQMRQDFAAATVEGGNFVIRMDPTTVEAMVQAGLSYFVVFMQHSYNPFSYRRMPVTPMKVWTPSGSIWMVPVNAESYNRPWPVLKNMITSAVSVGQSAGWPHVTVLLHPFRDGSLLHLGELERLLHYLVEEVGYSGVSLSESVSSVREYEPRSFIYYEMEPYRRRTWGRQGWYAWWRNTSRYQQRVGQLYQHLSRIEEYPALCLVAPDHGTVYGVYPCLPDGAVADRTHPVDPLNLEGSRGRDIWSPSTPVGDGVSLEEFVPRSVIHDLGSVIRWLRPRIPQDLTGLLPELRLRLGYRMSRLQSLTWRKPIGRQE